MPTARHRTLVELDRALVWGPGPELEAQAFEAAGDELAAIERAPEEWELARPIDVSDRPTRWLSRFQRDEHERRLGPLLRGGEERR